jgi:hypothetical protein
VDLDTHGMRRFSPPPTKPADAVGALFPLRPHRRGEAREMGELRSPLDKLKHVPQNAPLV